MTGWKERLEKERKKREQAGMEIFIVKREKHRREKAERPKTLIGFEQTCPHISAQPPAALKGLLDKELEEVERPVKGEKLGLYGNYCCTGKEGSRKYRQAQKRHWRSWMVMALIRKHSFEQSSAISGAELEIWLEINACVGVRKVTNDPLKVQKTRPKMAWCCGWCKQYITLCISMSSQEKYIIIICLFDKQYFFIIILSSCL